MAKLTTDNCPCPFLALGSTYEHEEVSGNALMKPLMQVSDNSVKMSIVILLVITLYQQGHYISAHNCGCTIPLFHPVGIHASTAMSHAWIYYILATITSTYVVQLRTTLQSISYFLLLWVPPMIEWLLRYLVKLIIRWSSIRRYSLGWVVNNFSSKSRRSQTHSPFIHAGKLPFLFLIDTLKTSSLVEINWGLRRSTRCWSKRWWHFDQ